MTPSLLPGPAFAGPKKGTSHLRAQSLSIPAELSLRAAGLEFAAIANTFLAFFLQHGSYHIQGMPDQTTTTFCIKNKTSLLFFLPFTQGTVDSQNLCIQTEIFLSEATLQAA